MPFSTKNFHAKTLTASIISVITEDIYLKLRIVVTIKRGTHTSRGDNPLFFSSPEHEVLMVSYCDQSMSVVRRASSTICSKS